MAGNINEAMCNGIDKSALVLVVITKNYLEKVRSDNQVDNCKKEFGHAFSRKTSAAMIPVLVVMEEQRALARKFGRRVTGQGWSAWR